MTSCLCICRLGPDVYDRGDKLGDWPDDELYDELGDGLGDSLNSTSRLEEIADACGEIETLAALLFATKVFVRQDKRWVFLDVQFELSM
jgi:hypothetical protein